MAPGAVTQSIQSPWNPMARTGNPGETVTEAEVPGVGGDLTGWVDAPRDLTSEVSPRSSVPPPR
jgi:hypothetical protein